MAERLVAADASPLIGLAAAGAFDLLRSLFVRITVTEAVRDEVLAGGELPGASELAAAIQDGWIEVVSDYCRMGFEELGAGEASTLALALNHQGACLVLMDDPLGRSHVRALGIVATGVAGVLLSAKDARLVHAIRPFFERLERREFRLSKEIVHAILKQAGEA